MSGYPLKITRAALGPTYENVSKITNPKKQLDAAKLNLLLWQLAGVQGASARGLVRVTLAATTFTVTHQWLAWDADGALAKMTFTHVGTGDYTWTLPNSGLFDDANGTSTAADLIGAVPLVQGTANRVAVGDVNVNGYSGTMKGFVADTAAAADISKFLMLLF